MLEYIGPGLTEVSFNIQLNSMLGTPPLAALIQLKKMLEKKQAERLLIGPDYLGKFVIESIGEERKYHNNLGICVSAEVSINVEGGSINGAIHSNAIQSSRLRAVGRGARDSAERADDSQHAIRAPCHLDRDFGLTWAHIDKPMPVAKMLMRSEVIDAIEEYEPRATVVSVDFDEDTASAMDGILKPRVVVQIGEEE